MEKAQEFDKATGQPDCIDPEKALILERVNKLEEAIQKLKEAL